MSSQAFYWINAALAAGILLLFVVRRGQQQPTRLKLRNQPKNAVAKPKKSVVTLDPETIRAQNLHGKEKSLNILFNYNGHSWDAFEVLGLPAGAPKAMVEEAYQRERAKVEATRRDFIDSAYQAIVVHRRGA